MLSISLAFHLFVGSRKRKTGNRRSRSVEAQKLWPATVQPQIRHDKTLLHLQQSLGSESAAARSLPCGCPWPPWRPHRTATQTCKPVENNYSRGMAKIGSFYYHCDWHASHYVKVMLDQI
jgi:hypothetical protein